jgi:anhydro-N-acetylmuramic acid kinase
VNIGGIANITILNPKQPVCGFDTGPGNTLLDHWCRTHTDASYDKDGRWANAGTIDTMLLTDMLADPYFSKAAPKSTGREYFNSDWLQACLARRDDLDPVDVQATLLELTAKTIAATVSASHAQKLFICGGGALNTFLMERISKLLDPIPTATTDVLGIPALWVEAVAFAWLAKSRLEESPAGRPSVTGARESALLGNIHQPAKI